MRANVLIVSFLIIMGVGSCNRNDTNHKKIRTIDSKSIIENDFNLSTLGSLSNLIPLETNENSLISSVDKIYFVDSLIYILDRQGATGVLVFNQNGKFIRKIGKVGKGPGEYVSIDDFTIDKTNSIVYLLTNREKILLYDHAGKHIRDFRIDFHASKIEYNDTFKRIYFIGDDREGEGADNLVITDLNGKKVKGFFPNKEHGQHVRILNHPFNNLDTLVLYRRFLDDNIYALKGDSLYVHHKIDFGNDALTESKLKEILKLDSKQFKSNLQNFKSHIKYYVENDRFVLFVFFHNKMPHYCIYNKDKDTSETFSIMKLHDDIFHSEIIPLIENISNRNEFVFIVQPGSILETLESTNNDTIKKTINSMIDGHRIKIDSNPIICLLTSINDKQP